MIKHQLDKYNHQSQTQSANYQPLKDRSFKIISLALVVFFISFGLVLGFYPITLISGYTLSKFIIGFTVLGFLIPLKFYQKWFHFIKYEVIIFNLFGLMPLLTALLLSLNYLLSYNETTNDYRIEKIFIEEFGNQLKHGVILENNQYMNERKIIMINDLEFVGISVHIYFRITTADGLFGFKVIKNRVFIEKE